MPAVHLALFVLSAAGAVCVLIVALAGAGGSGSFGRLDVHLWLDRLILGELIALVLTALIGPLLLVTGHQPQDLLHVVYAMVAVLALPIGRYVGRAGSQRRRSTPVAVAALVLLGVLLRLYMTG